MIEDNGTINIDDNTQLEIKNRRLRIKRLNDEIMLILNIVLNANNKSNGDYQPDREFTKLEIVKDKGEGNE